MPIRTLLLAALALAGTLRAQTPCVGGTAAVYTCDEIDLAAVIPTGVTGPLRTNGTNDIWGWTDPDTGNEYALVGTLSGTVFVDVTTPETPLVLGKLLTQSGNSTWRDIKVYADHAFVVSEADNHGMQVFDLTRLRGLTPDSQRDFAADVAYFGGGGQNVGSAHNIVINEDSGFAYVVGSGSCSGGLHMVNIQTPQSPAFAGCYAGRGYVHDAQCVVYDGPDADYTGQEICVTSNGDETVIVDVTDKSAPQFISNVFYPDTGYAHQGWFTGDKRYFVADDEADEFDIVFSGTRTIVFDVEDLDSPELAFFHFGTVFTSDHNLYIKDNLAFQSNYRSGLRILDLSGIDDDTLTEVAFFDTSPGSNIASYDGQWSNYPFFASGTIIATDQDEGLFVLTPTGLPSAAEPQAIPAGAGYVLSAPAPNPARGVTTLALSVARAQAVRAEVLDVAGRVVAVLFDGTAVAGAPLALRFDGAGLPAGLYLVRVTGEDFSATRRASLLR